MTYNEEFMKGLEKLQGKGVVRIIGETVIHKDAFDGPAPKEFEGQSLFFAFPDQSQSFCLGFEAGQLWQRMQGGEPVIDCGFLEAFPLRTDNLELVARMAAAGAYSIETASTGFEGWDSVRLTKMSKPKPRLRSVVRDHD